MSHLELVHEGLQENNEEEVGFGAAFICRRTAKTNWDVKMYMGVFRESTLEAT